MELIYLQCSMDDQGVIYNWGRRIGMIDLGQVALVDGKTIVVKCDEI